MSEDNDRDHNEEKKKTRRTRKDQEGRNFTCPCGKSYLSYPALYTHTKTKHHGKPPKQSATLSKVQNQQQNQLGYDSILLIKQIVQKACQNDNSQASERSQLPDEANQYINEICQFYEQCRQKKMQDITNNKNQTINYIFAKFLSQIKSKIKREGFLYLCQLVYIFAKYIMEQKKDIDYCKNNNGIQLPHYFNTLIVQKRVPEINGKGDSITNNLTLACKVFYNFGTWLFDHKFTNFSTKFNVL